MVLSIENANYDACIEFRGMVVERCVVPDGPYTKCVKWRVFLAEDHYDWIEDESIHERLEEIHIYLTAVRPHLLRSLNAMELRMLEEKAADDL